jgi:outer membrane receptor protein involved in Fe transport
VEGNDRDGDGTGMKWADDQWKFSWGAAIKKEFKSIGLTAQSTYGTYYRYPSFYEMYGDGVFVRPGAGYSPYIYRGIDRPSWENGEQWDVGLSWRGGFLWGEHYLAATYFNRKVNDLIGMVTSKNYWVFYQNVGKAEVDGFEFEANLGWSLATLYFSATYLNANIVESETLFPRDLNRTEIGPMLNQPEWEYFIRGDLTVPGLREKVKIFAEYKFLDKIPYFIDNTDNSVDYEEKIDITNLGMKLQVTSGMDFTIGVNDIMNNGPNQGIITLVNGTTRQIPDYTLVNYPQQGRTWYATAKYSF